MSRPLPMCQLCHRAPVKRRRYRFCSRACTFRAARKARPMCVGCRSTPVKSLRSRFCSRSCAVKMHAPEKIAQAVAVNRQRTAQRTVQALLEDCRALVDADGRVSLKDAVKVVARHRLIGYQRGWAAAWARCMRNRG